MIRIGLIGLGKMGISHHAILNAHPEVDLCAVCDSTQYVLDVLGKYTGIHTYNDYRKMIAAEKLDAVFVATPSRFHGEMVRYAIEHDLHVFCEKPFCLDIREGEELIALARSRNRVNQVGYHNRHVEAFREAKRLVGTGIVGKIHHVRAEAYGPVVLRPSGSTWRSNKNEGGGCLYDYASHAIDLLNFTVGAPQAVGGVVVNRIFSRDVDDEVYASCQLADGVTAQLAVNWSDESYRKMSTRLLVWGDKGRIIVDRQECQIYLREPAPSAGLSDGWTIRYTTDLTEPVAYYLRGEEYSRQVDHFVKCVQGKVAENDCSFVSAVVTDKVIKAITASAQGNWTPLSAAEGTDQAAPKAPAKRRFGFLKIG